MAETNPLPGAGHATGDRRGRGGKETSGRRVGQGLRHPGSTEGIVRLSQRSASGMATPAVCDQDFRYTGHNGNAALRTELLPTHSACFCHRQPCAGHLTSVRRRPAENGHAAITHLRDQGARGIRLLQSAGRCVSAGNAQGKFFLKQVGRICSRMAR